MADQPGSGPDPELTPEQESTVRRLLAEARHELPVPDEVAARLDRVLAGLADETASAGAANPTTDSTHSASGTVVELAAARRRRRNAGKLLVAAAAVIVGGVGIGQVIGTSTDDDADSGASSADQAPERTESQTDSGGGSGSAADSSVPAPAEGSSFAGDDLLRSRLPLTLAAGQAQQDAQAQLDGLPLVTQSELAAGSAVRDFRTDVPGFTCASQLRVTDDSELFPAYYDGRPVVLALRPLSGDTKQAEVLDCADATTLESFQLTLR